jgi:phosphoglycerate dehydrogenase-like enzyme
MSRTRVLIESDASQGAALVINPGDVRVALGSDGADIELVVNTDPNLTIQAMVGVDVVFSNHKFDIAAAKQASPSLRWIQVVSAGVEAYLKTMPEGVVLTNASGVHSEKGSEFILTSVLMLNYKIPFFASQKQQHEWSPMFGGPLRGKTVTMLGVGAIGKAAVEPLKQRGTRVLGVTSTGQSDADLDGCISLNRIAEILPSTDFLVSTLPLTPLTVGRIGGAELDLLPEGAGVVVVGRANVFDYHALASRLQSGRLGGAVLDVFPKEPLPKDDPLWNTPRLIMTPHCSIDDHDGYIDRCIAIFSDNMIRFRAEKPLRNIVLASRGY